MKLARKGIIWLAALFALLLGGLTVLADDLDGSSGMDVVIVMDTSGSMQNSKGGGAGPGRGGHGSGQAVCGYDGILRLQSGPGSFLRSAGKRGEPDGY